MRSLSARTSAPRPPVVSVADGQPRPRWRGRLHLWAFFVSIPAVVVLVAIAETVEAAFGLSVYGVSLAALFGTSAAYHVLARTDRAQRLMRRLDHSMIFVLIAGTYTPVCLLALPASWGRPMLIGVWLAAGFGVVVKLLAGPKLLRFSNVLYIGYGWLGLVALPVIVASLTAIEFILLVTGGVLYTVGAFMFARRFPRGWPAVFGYHEVWHGFTTLAALAHLGMVWSVAG